MKQSGTTEADIAALSGLLRQKRELRHKSLGSVAAASGISTAYVQKLETGAVKQPSPNVLYQLAESLDIDYAELMRLAGYVVPGGSEDGERRRNELTYALSSEELSEDEAKELSRYLEWYRHNRSER